MLKLCSFVYELGWSKISVWKIFISWTEFVTLECKVEGWQIILSRYVKPICFIFSLYRKNFRTFNFVSYILTRPNLEKRGRDASVSWGAFEKLPLPASRPSHKFDFVVQQRGDVTLPARSNTFEMLLLAEPQVATGDSVVPQRAHPYSWRVLNTVKHNVSVGHDLTRAVWWGPCRRLLCAKSCHQALLVFKIDPCVRMPLTSPFPFSSSDRDAEEGGNRSRSIDLLSLLDLELGRSRLSSSAIAPVGSPSPLLISRSFWIIWIDLWWLFFLGND